MKITEIDDDNTSKIIEQELGEEEQLEVALLQDLFSFCIPQYEGDCFRCNFHEVIQYMDNERKKHFILLLTKCFLLDGENNIYYSDKTIMQRVLVDMPIKFLKQHKLSRYSPYEDFHKSKNKIVYKNINGKCFIICEF